MSQTLLDNKYNPSKVENRWYKHWLEKKYFHEYNLHFKDNMFILTFTTNL